MGKITQHRTPAQLSQAAQEQRGAPPPPSRPAATALSLFGCPLSLLSRPCALMFLLNQEGRVNSDGRQLPLHLASPGPRRLASRQ